MLYNVKKLFRDCEEDTVMTSLGDAYSNRRIYFFDRITDRTAMELIAKLHTLEGESDDDICLYISTPGGSWSAALAVYDVIRNLESPVHTVCCGRVCDGGVLIAAAGKKRRRYIMPNAEIVINRIEDEIFGGVRDAEMRAIQVANLRCRVQTILTMQTEQPMAEIEKDTRRDMVLTADEAVRYGLCDRVGEALTFL